MPRPGTLKFTKESDILSQLGLGDLLAAAAMPQGPHCSYCGKDLQESEGTVGVGPLVKRVEEIAIRDSVSGEVIGHKDEITYSSSRLLACSDCCLRLVPQVERDSQGHSKLDKYGEVIYTRSRTKFEPYD